MPMIATSLLPLPDDWKEFEGICRDVYSRRWDDPNAHLNGREGQPQHGVDVYGRPAHLGGLYSGLQCKKYEDGRLTKKKIEAEITKAEGFNTGVPDQPLAEFIIATTEKRDEKLQAVVREISAAREQQGKFPVEIVFWEDIGDFLKDRQNHDLLVKYFPDWHSTFVEAYKNSDEYKAELSDLKQQLETIQERRIYDRWQALRQAVNGGYSEGERDNIVNLLAEAAHVAGETHLSPTLQGRVYLLAASAFYPVRPGGDANRSRQYLDKARLLLIERERVHYTIVSAALRFQLEGVNAALDEVQSLAGPEIERFRFSVHVDTDSLDSCSQILECVRSTNPRILETKEWRQLLALYHGHRGERTDLERVVASLTEGAAEAADYTIAAMAYTHLAYSRYKAFCERHGLCPTAPSLLGLAELVDTDARQQAATMHSRAAGLYKDHHCRGEAVRALALAINVDIDSDSALLRKSTLLDRLAELDPRHPLVIARQDSKQALLGLTSTSTPALAFPAHLSDRAATAAGAGTGPSQEGNRSVLAQVQTIVGNSDSAPTDLEVALELAATRVTDAAEAAQLIPLLAGLEGKFDSDEMRVRLLYALLQLYMLAGPGPDADRWLASLRPPEEYPYLAVLLPIQFYTQTRVEIEKAEPWIARASAEFGDNPEVLLAIVDFYRATKNYAKEAEYARRLHGIADTTTTAISLLDALFAARLYGEFLQTAADLNYLSPDQAATRRVCAEVCLRTNDLLQAREHLRWLRSAGLCTADDYHKLAFTYESLAQLDEAVDVLRECIERYPDDYAAYILLSGIYNKKRDRPASFHFALEALHKFPDNPAVASHFVHISTLTGFEDEDTLPSIFQSFMPGGSFEQATEMKMASIEEVIAILRDQRERSDYLWNIYSASGLSSMMTLYAQGAPLFPFHYVGTRLPGWRRYAAAGDQPYDAPWLKENSPTEVVLAYTGLLTLWSLYQERWVEVARGRFRCVWVPGTLPNILRWEHAQVATRGQKQRYEAQLRVKNAVEGDPTKFSRHDTSRTMAADPDAASDAASDAESPGDTAELSSPETLIAQDLNLPLVSEYAVSRHSNNERAVRLRSVAGILSRAGEIDLDMERKLAANTQPSAPGEKELAAKLPPGADIVLDLETMLRVAEAGVLDRFCAYFGTIHVSELAWQRLKGDILTYESYEEMVSELGRLHQSVSRAMEEGFVRTGYVAPEDRLLSRPRPPKPALAEPTQVGNTERQDSPAEPSPASSEEQAPDAIGSTPSGEAPSDAPSGDLEAASGDGESQDELPLVTLLLAYYDELLALAAEHHAPIWTDDRYTSKLYVAGRRAPHIFGTDAFLEWARTLPGEDQGAANDECFTSYGQLISWGYLGLPIHPEYLAWLMERGLSVGARPFQEATEAYRLTALEFFRLVDTGIVFPPGYLAQVMSTYHRSLSAVLARCYRRGLDANSGAVLFKALDLARSVNRFEGREPDFYGAMLLSTLMHVLPSGEPPSAQGIELVLDDSAQDSVHEDAGAGGGADAGAIAARPAPAAEWGPWLDNVLQTSGVSTATLIESWLGLLYGVFAEYEYNADPDNGLSGMAQDSQDGQDGQEAGGLTLEPAAVPEGTESPTDVTGGAAAAALAESKQFKRMYAWVLLQLAPEYVREHVARTPLGRRLRDELEIDLTPKIVFQLRGPAGRAQLSIPEETWFRDRQLATRRFLATSEAVSAEDGPEHGDLVIEGDVVIRARWLSEGSLFLYREETPNIESSDGSFTDAQIRGGYVCALSASVAGTVEERVGFWNQGLRKLESLGLPTAEWHTLRPALESSDSGEYSTAGLALQTELFGYREVARDHFAEAGGLGDQAVEKLLDAVTPGVARSWLGMPSLDWETAEGLTQWAEALVAQTLREVHAPRPVVAYEPLEHLYARMGYSVFPDALVWHSALVEYALGLEAEQMPDLVDKLLSLAETSASLPAVANTVVAVLRLHKERAVLTEQPEQAERLQALAGRVASAWTAVPCEQNRYAKLELELCKYLYTRWLLALPGPEKEQALLRELAYLAHTAAGFLVDAVAGGSATSQHPLSSEALADLAGRLELAAHEYWLSDPTCAAQPGGQFNPAWARSLGYALSYMLSGVERHGLAFDVVASRPEVRSELLNSGFVSRYMQAWIGNQEVGRDWLDAELAPDASGSIARLLTPLADSSRGTSGEWPEDAMQVLESCASAGSGAKLVARQFEALPSAGDERQLLSLIQCAFCPAPVWAAPSLQNVACLLRPQNIEAIKRFPQAYSELVLRLVELLSLSGELPADLAATVTEIAFGVPTEPGGAPSCELLGADASALAWVATRSSHIEEIQGWLRAVAQSSGVGIAEIRCAIWPFINALPACSVAVQDAVGAAFASISQYERFASMWELRMVARVLTERAQTLHVEFPYEV